MVIIHNNSKHPFLFWLGTYWRHVACLQFEGAQVALHPGKPAPKNTLHIERLTSKVAFTDWRLLRSLSFMKKNTKKAWPCSGNIFSPKCKIRQTWLIVWNFQVYVGGRNSNIFPKKSWGLVDGGFLRVFKWSNEREFLHRFGWSFDKISACIWASRLTTQTTHTWDCTNEDGGNRRWVERD